MRILIFVALAGFAAGLIACQSTQQEDLSVAGNIAAGSNRTFYHEVTTSAAPSEIWALWTDVSTWKDWDKGLEDAELDGPFVLGAVGKIVPLSGPSARFDITEFNDGTSYAFETRLPFARLEVRRAVVGTNPTVFRHDVSFRGVLSGFWADRFGPGFRRALPLSMDAIAEIAEQNSQVAS